MEKFTFDVLEINDFSITENEKKNFYNLDGLENYLEMIKNKSQFSGKKIDFPFMYGSLNFREKGSGKFYDDSLGYLVCEGDSVEGNPSSVFLISGPSYRGRGINVNKSNFLMITSYFSARLSIPMTWKNQKDSYIFDSKHFEDDHILDTVVYSLFNNSSSQCSARNIVFNNKNHNIKNEFFWMNIDEIKKIADEIGYDNLYNDARTDSNRFVFNFLHENDRISKLSRISQNLLEQSQNLVKISLNHRQHISNFENQLDCWDASYAQMKNIWREFFPNEYKTFRSTYKELDEVMKKRVYELEILL